MTETVPLALLHHHHASQGGGVELADATLETVRKAFRVRERIRKRGVEGRDKDEGGICAYQNHAGQGPGGLS